MIALHFVWVCDSVHNALLVQVGKQWRRSGKRGARTSVHATSRSAAGPEETTSPKGRCSYRSYRADMAVDQLPMNVPAALQTCCPRLQAAAGAPRSQCKPAKGDLSPHICLCTYRVCKKRVFSSEVGMDAPSTSGAISWSEYAALVEKLDSIPSLACPNFSLMRQQHPGCVALRCALLACAAHSYALAHAVAAGRVCG